MSFLFIGRAGEEKYFEAGFVAVDVFYLLFVVLDVPEKIFAIVIQKFILSNGFECGIDFLQLKLENLKYYP